MTTSVLCYARVSHSSQRQGHRDQYGRGRGWQVYHDSEEVDEGYHVWWRKSPVGSGSSRGSLRVGLETVVLSFYRELPESMQVWRLGLKQALSNVD